LVLLEAQACGKGVIASDLPGVRSVVVENVDGLLALPSDAGDLMKKMSYLLDHPETARSFGLNGREKVERKYSWQKVCRVLCDDIKKIGMLGDQPTAPLANDQSRAPHATRRPEDYERKRGGPYHRRRVEAILAAIRDAGPIQDVADLGSGTGIVVSDVASCLQQVNFTAIEMEADLTAYASKVHAAANINFRHGDATSPPADTYDFIYSLDFIHHLGDQAAAIRRISRALRPGGRWLIVEPNVWYPMAAVMQEQMKRRGMGEDHFLPWRAASAIQTSGLRKITRRYMHLLPALPVIAERWSGMERALERLPFIGASVVILLERPSVATTNPPSIAG
jgi:SAM-dependent methyltransferase